jgi:hypothetical protein
MSTAITPMPHPLPVRISYRRNLETTETHDGMEQDTFSLTDRKELIRQGLQLDKIEEDLMDIKVLFNGALSEFERKTERASDLKIEEIKMLGQKIRTLEDNRLVFETRMKTLLWVASAAGVVFSAASQLVIHIFGK